MSKSVYTLATELSNAFTRTTRTNGDVIYILKDESPEWMTDTIRGLHSGSLPDDTVYEMIRDCALAIAESDEDNEPIEAIYEMEPEHRTYQLIEWLKGNTQYADQAMEESGPYTSISDLLMAAQKIQIDEIGASLISALESIVDDFDKDEDSDE